MRAFFCRIYYLSLMDAYHNSRKIEFDNLFKIPISIDVAHHEIHEGDTYSASLADTSAASGEYVQGYILTPAVTVPQKRMHMILSHEGSGLHSFTITDGVTFTSGGAAATAVNRRRDSANTADAQAVRVGGDNMPGGLLVYTGGTVIWSEAAGAGRGSGSSSRGIEEWILAPNETYMFELMSGATSTSIAIQATWYEHEDSS